MWVKKDMPLIPGYESLGDQVAAKSWLDFRLDRVLEADDELKEYVNSQIPGSGANLVTREQVCDFVISQIDYPFRAGVPTDRHRNNWFDGSCCHSITNDFWMTASETLRTLRLNKRDFRKGYGDCEDASFLFTALFLLKQWEAWAIIGYVRQAGQILGGHGWALFSDDAGQSRLYESTLDVPPVYPSGYPVGPVDATSWYVETLEYEGIARFRLGEYYENSDMTMGLKSYIQNALRRKESKKKYSAISQAWGMPTKPLAHPSLLTRIRWRS